MKVKELIEKLSKCNQELEVFTFYDNDDPSMIVIKIDVVFKENYVLDEAIILVNECDFLTIKRSTSFPIEKIE